MTSDVAEPLSPETIVWRYMGIGKLLALLTTRALHFTRLDSFEDPWEGVLPTKREKRIEEMEGKVSEGYVSIGRRMRKEHRKLYFLNCWHMSEHQSAALWNQYASAGFADLRSVASRKRSAEHPISLYAPFATLTFRSTTTNSLMSLNSYF
jgi:hypothetical protein